MSLGIGGAAFLRNLPAQGAYQVNEQVFNTETERNDVPLAPAAYTGLGGATVSQRIPNNGILASMKVLFKGQAVVAGGGSITAGYQFPWNILKRATLNANGQTSLINAEGLDFRARKSRLYRNPPTGGLIVSPAMGAASGDPAPGVIANGTYPIVLEWDIPITHDEATLVGALFAQSDQNYLELKLTPAQQADLVTAAGGSTIAITGSFFTTITFFDIPLVPVQGRDQVIIPNLAWLHGFLSGDYSFANTGDVRAPFIRTAGQLLAYLFYVDNGGIAQIAPTALNEVRFAYGGNRKPRVYNPPEQVLLKNLRDYAGLIQPGYVVFDFEGDNPARDLVYPKGVSELAIEINVPSTVTVNTNARIHFVEDTLFAGR
jgi:hypothetical protein